jgi:hypothetical protein
MKDEPSSRYVELLIIIHCWLTVTMRREEIIEHSTIRDVAILDGFFSMSVLTFGCLNIRNENRKQGPEEENSRYWKRKS